MTLRFKQIIATMGMTSTLLLAGCGGTGGMDPSMMGTVPQSNAVTGSVTGSVMGGVIGNQFGKGDGKQLATILGTIIGGYIGGAMGAQMDAQDRARLGAVVNTGRPATWQNPSTGYRYTATPGQVYQSTYQNQQTICRPVTILGQIDGRAENIQMKACKGANGQWQTS